MDDMKTPVIYINSWSGTELLRQVLHMLHLRSWQHLAWQDLRAPDLVLPQGGCVASGETDQGGIVDFLDARPNVLLACFTLVTLGQANGAYLTGHLNVAIHHVSSFHHLSEQVHIAAAQVVRIARGESHQRPYRRDLGPPWWRGEGRPGLGAWR